MSRIIQVQTNFTSGELDPRLRARIDLQQYYNGLETAQNIVIQPQGGFTRREGTKYLATLPSDAGAAVRMVHFEFSIDDSYMLIFVNQRMYIFKNAVQITNINGSGNPFLAVTPIVTAIINNMCWAQAADTLILVHQDMVPQKIVRGASDSSWAISNLEITNTPQFAFTYDTHSPTFTITPSAITGNITVTASSVTTDTGTAQAGSANTITLKAASSYSADNQPNGMFIEITSGTGSGQTRHVEDYVTATKVLTVYPAWSTAPDSSSQYEVKAFKPAAVGEYIIHNNGFGRARITEYSSDTVVKAYVEIPFFDNDAIVSGDWEIEHGYEDAWSATRGWPRSAVFYEGRLYFGGSKSLPSTLWGSKVGDFFNFDPGELLDDTALEATLDTGRFNAIVDLYAGRNLQIFTTGGEFYVPQNIGNPITPNTLAVQEQTSNGSRQGIRVVNVDGATVFVQRQGKALAEFVFSDTVNGYVSTKISLLSSHLLKAPSDMSVRKATSTDEGDRLLIVNSQDGSIACYTLLRSQQIIAPSEWTTDGEYLSVGVDISDTYVVTKRTINGSAAYYVEVFDAGTSLDCSKFATVGSSTATVTGLSFLVAESVKVIRDGIVESDKTVSAGGVVTFTLPATSSYSVGLNFTPTVVTLPTEPRLSSGNVRSFKKRILEVNSEHFESQAVTVNGEQVAFRSFGDDNLDIPIQEFTGIKRTGPLLGFSREGKITITQTVPLKMNVIALDYKLSVGQ